MRHYTFQRRSDRQHFVIIRLSSGLVIASFLLHPSLGAWSSLLGGFQSLVFLLLSASILLPFCVFALLLICVSFLLILRELAIFLQFLSAFAPILQPLAVYLLLTDAWAPTQMLVLNLRPPAQQVSSSSFSSSFYPLSARSRDLLGHPQVWH